MIEDLTIEKLIEYGFSDENIDRFKSWDNYEMMFHNGLKGTYWASNKEKKIYSGKDAFRKKYFTSDSTVNFPINEPDLIPEYYKRKESIFLKKNKESVGQIFKEAKSKERFKQKEIELTTKEINAAKIEIENQRIQLLKQSASNHCLVMENYLDWLSELDVNSIPDKNVTSIAKRVKPINEFDYFNIYVSDEDIMSHYEQHLKKVNPNLSLETTINELSQIFSIIENWNKILLNERHKNAPSKELATVEFKKELLELIDQNDENYCHKFRRIGYGLRKKGIPVQLKGLGYLFLKHWVQTVEGEDVITNVSIVFDAKIILVALAEGAAIAEFVHSDNVKTLEKDKSSIDSGSASLKPQTDSSIIKRKIQKPKVFFSYAWNEASEAIVTKLYNSLKEDGYPVVMDKTDLHYKKSISEFMQTIGKGEVVVVAISDKYLKSHNCMFELYELYRNSKLEKEQLLKKIYPLRIDEINLQAPETISVYLEHWKKHVEQFRNLVVSHDYDQEQYLRIKNIYDLLGKLLPFLSDINASTKELLSENNFTVIKNAIANRIK